MWAAEAFLDLSGDRDWIATFGGAAPRAISDAAIRDHYYRTLGLASDRLFDGFRRWMRAMDLVWQRDWSRKAEARAIEERERAKDKGRREAPV